MTRQFVVQADPEPALGRLGWQVRHTDDGFEADRGSQLKTRFLGGWFVSSKTFPMSATVRRLENEGEFLVTATEAMGFGYLDRRFRARYERAFDELERTLSGPGS